jgi:hypothetical protein
MLETRSRHWGFALPILPPGGFRVSVLSYGNGIRAVPGGYGGALIFEGKLLGVK